MHWSIKVDGPSVLIVLRNQAARFGANWTANLNHPAEKFGFSPSLRRLPTFSNDDLGEKNPCPRKVFVHNHLAKEQNLG